MFTRSGKFYNLFGPEKSRDIAFFPSTLKRVQIWRVSRVRSFVAGTYRALHSRGLHLRKFLEQKKTFTYEKGSTPTGLVWNTNMVVVLLFWKTNMADVTYQNVLYLNLVTVHQ